MIVLNDKDESLIDETSILEMDVTATSYEDPVLKYKLGITFKGYPNTRGYFYRTKDSATKDRNQIVDLVQARRLNV